MTTKEAQKNMANLRAYLNGLGMPKEDRDALPFGTTRTDLLSYAKGYEDAKREAREVAEVGGMPLPLTIEYRMGGQGKWETLHLRIKTDDGFNIEYHEKDSHNADVRFESETYEKAKKYLYDALLNYPHFYRVEEKAEHLEYNKQQLIIAEDTKQRERLIA